MSTVLSPPPDNGCRIITIPELSLGRLTNDKLAMRVMENEVVEALAAAAGQVNSFLANLAAKNLAASAAASEGAADTGNRARRSNAKTAPGLAAADVS